MKKADRDAFAAMIRQLNDEIKARDEAQRREFTAREVVQEACLALQDVIFARTTQAREAAQIALASIETQAAELWHLPKLSTPAKRPQPKGKTNDRTIKRPHANRRTATPGAARSKRRRSQSQSPKRL